MSYQAKLWIVNMLKKAFAQSQMEAKPCYGWERSGLPALGALNSDPLWNWAARAFGSQMLMGGEPAP